MPRHGTYYKCQHCGTRNMHYRTFYFALVFGPDNLFRQQNTSSTVLPNSSAIALATRNDASRLPFIMRHISLTLRPVRRANSVWVSPASFICFFNASLGFTISG